MKIAIGVAMTVVGALGTLIATPYAIIVAMMSKFSEEPAILIAYCAAVPILGIGILVTGIRTIMAGAKPAAEETENEK